MPWTRRGRDNIKAASECCAGRELSDHFKTLLLEEIVRIIAEAERANEVVRAGYHAGQLLSRYPGASLSLGRIIDEVVVAATAAKVPVEIDRSA